jgi:tetratricopeptide (TPR) repeat protein
MKRIIIGISLALAIALTGALAQQPATQQKQPAPKSKGELEAIQAMFNAADPDTRIKAADELVAKYADTDFKDLAMFLAAFSSQQKGDSEKAIVYAERALEANPKHIQSMLILAETIAQRTRERDLDREEKLVRAEKYANGALEALKDAPKPNPSLTDEQWEAGKKDLGAQAHQALGMAAMARKKNDVAITEFKLSTETAANPDPATFVRLAQAYSAAGKHDEAIATAQKVMDMTDVHPQIKQVAQAVRAASTQAKGGGTAQPATPATPADPGPPQVEIKKQP